MAVMAYQKKPYVRRETKGARVAWCSCGESSKAPYCDGSHARLKTGKEPIVITVPDDRILAYCGCGRTGNGPFCDASHKNIKD